MTTKEYQSVQVALWTDVTVAYVRSRDHLDSLPGFRAIKAADEIIMAFNERFPAPLPVPTDPLV